MIASTQIKDLTETERSQLDRRDWARGAWSEGRPGDALLILESVLVEDMAPRVAAECHVTHAAFLGEMERFDESGQALEKAAPFIDSADLRVQASFYFQRGRFHKENKRYDAALTDYSGAASFWKALGNTEREVAALNNLASLYLLIEDLDQAQENINAALSLDPGSEFISQVYDTQANIFLVEGKLEAALNAHERSLDLCANGLWRETFERTGDRITRKLLYLLGVDALQDLEVVKVGMVRRALIETGGSLSGAAVVLGLGPKGHKGVDWIISKHPELEPLRVKRRERSKFKSIIKQ